MIKMTMYDTDTIELVEQLAKDLQKIADIKPPVWASFAKTGVHRERPPAREDWWYVRAASILRKIMIKGPIGVSKLRTLYGGRKHRGHAPEIFKRGSGNIIRKILQQLEKAELIKKGEKGVHKGRIITPKGIKLIDTVSKRLVGSKPKEVIEVKEKKPEIKEVKPKAEEKPKEVKEKVPENTESKE